MGYQALWQDRDRRRALLLSLMVHLLVVLAIAIWVTLPDPVPLESFIIIDIGTPAEAIEEIQAPASASPAPLAQTPQVEAPEAGESQATALGLLLTVPTPDPVEMQLGSDVAPPEPEAATPLEVPPQAIPLRAPPPGVRLPASESGSVDLPLADIPATTLPQIDAEVLVPRPLAESIQIPRPTSVVQVPEARALALTPTVIVAPGGVIPKPSVEVAVAVAEAIPQPLLRVVVVEDQPDTRAPTVFGETRAGAFLTQGDVDSDRLDNRLEGGDAPRSGQTVADAEADASNLGAAAEIDRGEALGSRLALPPTPFQERRERPLMVLIDNVGGYPQSGLFEAAQVVEMPVEGGLTRLMTVFDRSDPDQVGPIRSARDYFVMLAQSVDGILVHDGGSPSALAAISRDGLTTFNAYSRGELFSRFAGRSAPYNLYSYGTTLREAVDRLGLERPRSVSGVIYRPPESSTSVGGLEIRFSGVYSSGFVYVEEEKRYHWLRNEEGAVDAFGERVLVDAVVVASIEARPLPDDPEGRLYIPLRGGLATLFIGGKMVSGSWSKEQGVGVEFVSDEQLPVDLSPFKTWMILTPEYNGMVLR